MPEDFGSGRFRRCVTGISCAAFPVVNPPNVVQTYHVLRPRKHDVDHTRSYTVRHDWGVLDGDNTRVCKTNKKSDWVAEQLGVCGHSPCTADPSSTVWSRKMHPGMVWTCPSVRGSTCFWLNRRFCDYIRWSTDGMRLRFPKSQPRCPCGVRRAERRVLRSGQSGINARYIHDDNSYTQILSTTNFKWFPCLSVSKSMTRIFDLIHSPYNCIHGQMKAFITTVRERHARAACDGRVMRWLNGWVRPSCSAHCRGSDQWNPHGSGPRMALSRRPTGCAFKGTPSARARGNGSSMTIKRQVGGVKMHNHE